MIRLRRYLILIFVFILTLFLLFFPKEEKEVSKMDEKRFIFISYIEIAKYLKGKDETALKNTIDEFF